MDSKKRKHSMPLLLKPGGSISINDDEREERNAYNKQSISYSVKRTISNHIEDKINRFFLRYGGFRSSPLPVRIFVFVYLFVNLAINATTIRNSEYCLFLNICVLCFQVESVVLYCFAFASVSTEFIQSVVYQLVNIDVSSKPFQQLIYNHTSQYGNKNENKHSKMKPKQLVIDDLDDDESLIMPSNVSLKFGSPERNNPILQRASTRIYAEYKPIQIGSKVLLSETLKCFLVILPSYLSGYLIFFTTDTSNIYWHIYVYISNTFDIVRYLPQILHIALVRSYYATFPIELNRLRQRFGVIQRKDELTEIDYYKNKYILNIKHDEFICECEKVIRPYRRLSGQLSDWIAVYFLCNIAGFTFFLLSVASALLKNDCYYGTVGIYYLHYLMELVTFFGSWMFLVWPYCTNEYYLAKFLNDVRTMANVDSIEKCAIDRYIDSYNDRSPFSIYSIKPSYSKFMNVLYIVFATIILDVITKIENIDLI